MRIRSDFDATRGYFQRTFRERKALKLLPPDSAPDHYRDKEVKVAIYFGSVANLAYQVNQWLDPFRAVLDKHEVVLVTRKPTAALEFLQAGWPNVVYLKKLSDVDEFMHRHPIQLMFYVNNSGANLGMLAFPATFHISLGHGESDKTASSTNQFRAYTFVFVPGEAGRRRFANQLLDFDWQYRIREVGRPQIDTEHPTHPIPESDRISVLYAPTWEGDKPTGRYGSTASHGVAMVSSLLSSGRYRVVFRPHPLAGSLLPAEKVATLEIQKLLLDANKQDPHAHHVLDDSPSFGWHLAQLDMCISDISSVAFDWMATGKPLIVTEPAAESTIPSPTGISVALPLLRTDQAQNVADICQTLSTDGMPDSYRDAIRYYFGDTSPGSSRKRFRDAVDALLEEHSRALVARSTRREVIAATPITEQFGHPTPRNHNHEEDRS